MKILFLLPDFPYPVSTGGRFKIFNILKYLSKQHQCDILCFGNLDQSKKTRLMELLPNVQILDVIPPVSGMVRWMKSLWYVACGLPPSFSSFSDQKYVSVLKRHLVSSDYNLVHYDIVNMAQYLPFSSNIASIHSPNDATSNVYFLTAASTSWSFTKIRLLISAILLRRFERNNYHKFNKIHVVSQADAEYLIELVSGVDVSVIPIAINKELLQKTDLNRSEDVTHTGNFRIVCTGNLGNPEIAKGVRDFVNVALPLIFEKVPNVRFVLLGQNASQTLQEMFRGHTNIEFLTWADDYREFLAGANLVLVPDNMGPPGAKVRTLQAMGLGLPIVGTTNAFAGINFIDGKHGLRYKTMAECAEQVLLLFSDKKICKYLGENAYQLAMEDHSLSVLGPRYERLYQEAIAKFNSPQRTGL